MIELTDTQLAELIHIQPDSEFGAVGQDPDGGRKRIVRPVFGADNVYRLLGREFEEARAGEVTSIRVGRLLRPTDLHQQLLLWADVAKDTRAPAWVATGKEAMHFLLQVYPAAYEVRTAVLTTDKAGEVVVRLQTGESIDLITTPDPLSPTTYVPGGWYIVLDEAVDVERRLLNPRRIAEVDVSQVTPGAKGYVLCPMLHLEGGAAGGQLVPVTHYPFNVWMPACVDAASDTGPLFPQNVYTAIHWIGTVPGGEEPVLLSQDEVRQLIDGTASDLLYNTVRNRAAVVHELREQAENGKPFHQQLARLYGLHVRASVTQYLTHPPSITFDAPQPLPDEVST